MKTTKDADVDRLTREQIENWRKICLSHWIAADGGDYLSHHESAQQANALCDLALQSLSQEAVRDEALEEVERLDKLLRHLKSLQVLSAMGPWKACERGAESAYLYGHDGQPIATWFWKAHGPTETLIAENEAYCSLEWIAAIKNNWQELWTLTEKAIRALKREPNAAGQAEAESGEPDVSAGPAPAAPDVAEMVKRLESEAAYHELHGFIDTKLLLRQAAALLAKLGQAQSPFVVNWTTEGCPKHNGQPWTMKATTLYTEIGKRCPLCNPPGASDD